MSATTIISDKLRALAVAEVNSGMRDLTYRLGASEARNRANGAAHAKESLHKIIHVLALAEEIAFDLAATYTLDRGRGERSTYGEVISRLRVQAEAAIERHGKIAALNVKTIKTVKSAGETKWYRLTRGGTTLDVLVVTVGYVNGRRSMLAVVYDHPTTARSVTLDPGLCETPDALGREVWAAWEDAIRPAKALGGMPPTAPALEPGATEDSIHDCYRELLDEVCERDSITMTEEQRNEIATRAAMAAALVLSSCSECSIRTDPEGRCHESTCIARRGAEAAGAALTANVSQS